MKRNRISLTDIAALDNLMLATWKAARGKRHRPDVIRFTHWIANLVLYLYLPASAGGVIRQ